MGLRIGVGLPTCREGVAYPVGYVRPSDFARIAQRAEHLGFHSLWANDHLTTPNILQATLDQPPSFYEPLITFASVATPRAACGSCSVWSSCQNESRRRVPRQ